MTYELHETFVRRLSDNACIPLAEGNRDYAEYLAWVAEGNTPTSPPEPPPPTPEEVQADLTIAVQAHLDKTAQERRYDNILSLCTYATSPNPKFAAEGQAGVAWRDAVWTKCYAVLADVNAGMRSIPTSGDLVAELPDMVW